MKILYLQYAGDFSNDYQRVIIDGENEQYYGQSYCLKYFEAQSQIHSLTTIVLFTEPKEIKLNKMKYIGLGFSNHKIDYKKLFKCIKNISPDKVILRFPDTKILRYLRKSNIDNLPILADSFGHNKGIKKIKSLINNFLLNRELSNAHIKFISNHQINACLSINKLGVPLEKIIPYDWLHKFSPSDWSKQNFLNNQNLQNIKLFFVGSLIKTKGIYDILNAIKTLENKKLNIFLTIAGADNNNKIAQYCKQLNIDKSVKLLGKISNTEVMQQMLNSHAVIVASHSEYPEGLPMTIMESLLTHTPILASTHPMFVDRIGTNNSIIFFKEKKPIDLANKILLLSECEETYKDRVNNAPKEWENLVLRTKWADVIDNYIANNYTEMAKLTLKTE